ncbi:undecaprenyl pyrophosphate synthetase 2 [Streptomyces filamentosus NRRL 11379]|uniref:Isoprenyl transferase n=1 Tax=Streptomyces filamentosus NRRL 15998 TaxID=457431 RepID=D6ABF6_STRFL|nr:isoprenyl transferase [Streptomyces sp. SID5466]EFE76461.1 undecaprenyl pyrophosphate synthetase 2 [Streptomyces filamentosus NRRL 15998]EWS93433.1 undecaprenyl pyrophosphate synthetase 2 [Streptomyces filamentosus NRRL 11379]
MRIRTRVRAAVDALYAKRLSARLAGRPRPGHIGIMLDGNRRWAKVAGYKDPREGYKAGGAKVVQFLQWCGSAEIEHVTLFMLSDDNLNRPERELLPLIGVIEDVVDQLAAPANPWVVEIVGALDLLPAESANRLKRAAAETHGRTGGTRVDIAVGYGGRREIVHAVRSAILEHGERGGDLEELAETFTMEHISKHLYSKVRPESDLIIRTSGEQRLSGFLLWQSAYAEVYFCECYWPDFREIDFLRALRSYSERDRRYGR